MSYFQQWLWWWIDNSPATGIITILLVQLYLLRRAHPGYHWETFTQSRFKWNDDKTKAPNSDYITHDYKVYYGRDVIAKVDYDKGLDGVLKVIEKDKAARLLATSHPVSQVLISHPVTLDQETSHPVVQQRRKGK